MGVEDRPLRVTVIGLNYAPEPTGIAPYTAGAARGLAARGHRVRVVTGYPHYPWWEVAEGYTGWRRTERDGEVRVRRVRHYVPAEPSTLRRSLMELVFGVRAALSGWGRPDVVLLVSPALLGSRVALVRARAGRVPVVTWVQDIYTLGLVQTGGDRRQERLVRTVERGLLGGSRRVVAIHERFRSWLTGELGVEVPVDVVRNWSHVAPALADRSDDVRRQHGWAPEDVVVLHAGNMGAKQGLDHVVAASRVAAERGSRVRFVLLGDGNQRAHLESLGGNARLQFLDPLPDGLFERTLAAADVLLVNELPGLTEMSVPSKLTSYFATGLPVVASVDASSTTAAEIELSGGGVVVDPREPAALVEEVERLAAEPERAAALGAAGRGFNEAHLAESAGIDGLERSLRAATYHRS